MIDRERKVDVSKLPKEQVDQLSVQIGDRVRMICDEAAAKVNSILAVYGMSAKIAIQFDAPLGEKPAEKAPKKRAPKPRKSLNSNLKNE